MDARRPEPYRMRTLRPSSAVYPHHLSRSLHSVYAPPPPTIATVSWGSDRLGRGVSQTIVPPQRRREEEEKQLEKAESRPVLRRRRFNHRKLVNLEPATSLILATGPLPSSSEEEEEEDQPRLRGPSARRFSRRHQQRAHLSMHCLPHPPSSPSASHFPSPFSPSASSLHPSAHPALRAKSMADLPSAIDEDDDDVLDFSSQASVTRWTSRMLAELESLPGSRLDLSTVPNAPTVSSPTPPPIPPHRSSASIYLSSDEQIMIGSVSSVSSGSRLSLHSQNTEASTDTLRMDSPISLSCTSLTDGHSEGIETLRKKEEEELVMNERRSSSQDLQSTQTLSVLEDDKYPLLQSIYRLSQSMYAETAESDEEGSLAKWQAAKASCQDRLGVASSVSTVATSSSTPPVVLESPPPSVEQVVQSLLRAAKRPKAERKDAITQTSPPLSRSSSFDWLESTSSPQIPSTPISLRRGDSSSGEDAADREVREVTTAANTRKMRARPEHGGRSRPSPPHGQRRRGCLSSTLSEISQSHQATVVPNAYEDDDDDIVSKCSKVSLRSAKTIDSQNTVPSTDSQFLVDLAKAEKKAAEACAWLRSAGFPQYAQSYEVSEGLANSVFPLNLDKVLADHKRILDSDSVAALTKRLNSLNRCAIMKMDGVVLRDRSSILVDSRPSMRGRKDDGVALSDNWRYQRHSQSWQRREELDDRGRISQRDRLRPDRGSRFEAHGPSPPPSSSSSGASNSLQRRDTSMLQRSHSERIKEKAKAMFKRIDVRPKPKKETMVISDPILLSYDSASPQSMRMFPGGRLPLTSGHQRLSQATRSASTHHPDRRQGIVFPSPSSPDSSDDSSNIRLSRYGEAAPVRSLLSRDRSVPSRIHTIRRTLNQPIDLLYPSRNPPQPRAGTPTVSSRASTDYSTSLSTPPVDRRRLPQTRAVYSPIYLVHADISPDFDIHRLAPASSPRLNVETSRDSIDDLDGMRRDSGAGSSLSRSPSSATGTIRISRSILAPAQPLSSIYLSSASSTTTSTSTTMSSCSSNCSPKQPIEPSSSIGDKDKKEKSDETFMTDAQLRSSMDGLSAVDTSKYSKLAYLRLTALLEKHMKATVDLDENIRGQASRNWRAMLMNKIRNNDQKQSNKNAVFGQPLSSLRRHNGQCLPRTILEIIAYLRENCVDSVGIFRKNGVKSRIGELRLVADRESDCNVFVGDDELDPGQVHDVADLLKQYLRELPEPLMTNRLSKTFANIHEHVPEDEKLVATRYGVMLLPEENREALQTLLFFFADVAKNADKNSMHAENIAVCLTPSLFQLSASRLNSIGPIRRHKTISGTGMPTDAEMRETRAAQSCLTLMIKNAVELFIVHDTLPKEMSREGEEDLPLLKEICPSNDYPEYLMDRVQALIKESTDKWRRWIVEGTSEGIEMSYKKSKDGIPIDHFRAIVEVEAPPELVIDQLVRDSRCYWDTSVVAGRVMEELRREANYSVDLWQFVLNDSPAHPTRECAVVRMKYKDHREIRGACVLVERSVRSSESQSIGGITAAVLDSRYLIEPHHGKSRVTLVSRVDLRGRRPEWYNQQYPFILARHLSRLRLNFVRTPYTGPETKV